MANKKPMQFTDDPLFKSVKGALLFALNYTHGGMKKPSMTALMGGTSKGRGLAGLDGAAQAGMIELELEHLADLERALLVARYAIATEPCSCRSACCQGWRESREWGEAINWLTDYVGKTGLGGNVSHWRFRRVLVARCFGVRKAFIAIGKECGVEKSTASRRFRKISDHLKAEEKKARWKIEGILKGQGVVEDVGLAR